MRCTRETAGISIPTTDDPGTERDFDRCPSSHQANGFGGAWPRPAICAPGKKTDYHTAEGEARNHHRDSVVSSPQGVAGNEKADEWAKLVVEEPNARGEE